MQSGIVSIRLQPIVALILRIPAWPNHTSSSVAGLRAAVYELLQAETSGFLLRTGQAQYGVDIVTEATDPQTIYQCKNHAEPSSFRRSRRRHQVRVRMAERHEFRSPGSVCVLLSAPP